MKIYNLQVGPVQTNCYIATTLENNCVIVDPGDTPKAIIGKIRDIGATPKAILLTHGHFDHIGGVKALCEEYGALPVYLGDNEMEVVLWSEAYLEKMGFSGVTAYIQDNAILVSNKQEIVIDELVFKVMHTPGHTKGGVIYICEDTIFSGDTLFYEEIGRCDLPTGDYQIMLQTLKKIAALSGDYTVYPGHDNTTTLEHERQYNPYINNR